MKPHRIINWLDATEPTPKPKRRDSGRLACTQDVVDMINAIADELGVSRRQQDITHMIVLFAYQEIVKRGNRRRLFRLRDRKDDRRDLTGIGSFVKGESD